MLGKLIRIANEHPETRDDLLPIIREAMKHQAAVPKKFEDLPSKEQAIAKKMMAKGYLYIVQVTTVNGNFGEPLYFKLTNDVGPFLRSFPDYEKAKTAWNFPLKPETRKKAMEHKSPDAMKKYLHEHPKADKSKHYVGKPSPADKLRNELSDEMKKKKEQEPKVKPGKKDEKKPGKVHLDKKFVTKHLDNSVISYLSSNNDPGVKSLVHGAKNGLVTESKVEKALKYYDKQVASMKAPKTNKPIWWDAEKKNVGIVQGILKKMKAEISKGADAEKTPVSKKDEKKPAPDKKLKKHEEKRHGYEHLSKDILDFANGMGVKDYNTHNPLEEKDIKKVYETLSTRSLPDLKKMKKEIVDGWGKAVNNTEYETASGRKLNHDQYMKVVRVYEAVEAAELDVSEIKAFKKKKPTKGQTVSDAVLMQRFLAKAKPETKERMKGMSPADFMKILGAITDEDEGGGKQASLRGQLIRIAHKYPKTRKHLLPLLKS